MRRDGFTLIELIVVIVITSILAVVSANFLSQGVSFYVEATAIKRINSDVEFVATKLRRLFENSIPNSLKISSDETMATFVPATGSLGYFYVSKETGSGIDQDERVIYAVRSPFFTITKNCCYAAFANSEGDVAYYTISQVDETDDSVNGSRYRLVLSNNGTFTPLTASHRLYLADIDKRYVSICYAGDGNGGGTIRLYRHAKEDDKSRCPTQGTVIADNIASLTFVRDTGSYNASGELLIHYEFLYSKMNITRQISQRIGVANAP